MTATWTLILLVWGAGKPAPLATTTATGFGSKAQCEKAFLAAKKEFWERADVRGVCVEASPQ